MDEQQSNRRVSKFAQAAKAELCAANNREYAAAVATSDPDAAYRWSAKAHDQEQEAASVRLLVEMPTLGLGGDLVPPEAVIGSYAAGLLKSGNVTALHTEASCERIKLAQDTQSFELGADAAEAVKASDPIELMLIYQAAAFHKHAMQYLARAGDEANTIERCRLANTSARLAVVSQEAILTLQRKRTGGKQTVLVQHVSVNEGAQAVIGSVQTGGKVRRVGGKGRK